MLGCLGRSAPPGYPDQGQRNAFFDELAASRGGLTLRFKNRKDSLSAMIECECRRPFSTLLNRPESAHLPAA
jgi:hypothetical protein